MRRRFTYFTLGTAVALSVWRTHNVVVAFFILVAFVLAWSAVDYIRISWAFTRAERAAGRDADARRRGFCPNCGYDLRASPNQCPECGTPNITRRVEAERAS